VVSAVVVPWVTFAIAFSVIVLALKNVHIIFTFTVVEEETLNAHIRNEC
jgi:hypothetical protein